MRTLIAILTFLFLFQISDGQDTVRHFEFGSTLITVNSFNTDNYFERDRPPVEFINGLFFRYTKKRFGLRVHASYSDNFTSYDDNAFSNDPSSGDSDNKDFRIGVGGQRTLLKRKEWFYTFLDLSYRNVFSTGHSSGGGASDKFSRVSNGFDCFFGLGFKIKTLKNVYLSPEFGSYSSTKFINQKSTSMYYNQSIKYSYSETILKLAIKLHLTVKF